MKFFDRIAGDLITEAFPMLLDYLILPSSKEIVTSEVRLSTIRICR